MKKYFIAIIAIASIFVFGCQQLPTMTATVGGVSKNFMFRQTSKVVIPEVGDGMVILATTGIDSTDGEYMAIVIRGAEQKTYDLSVTLANGKTQCAAIYRPNDSTYYVAKSGSVTISSITSKKVSGSFSFEMVNKVIDTETFSVTNGKFEFLRYYEADIADLADIAIDF